MNSRRFLRSSSTISSRLSQPRISSFSPLRQSSPFLNRPPVQASAPQIPARCYSDSTEAKKEDLPQKDAASSGSNGNGDKASGQPESQPPSAEETLRKELEAKNREIIDLKDKYLRSVADFRNLQDRTKREITSAKSFALSSFLKDVLPSLENLDAALSSVSPDQISPLPETETTETNSDPDATTASTTTTAAPTNYQKDLQTLHSGLKMTEQILLQTLEKHGLKRHDPAATGEKFDPNVHEAVTMMPQPGKADGSVFFTQRKGYTLNGRVLRAAQVGVVKNA